MNLDKDDIRPGFWWRDKGEKVWKILSTAPNISVMGPAVWTESPDHPGVGAGWCPLKSLTFDRALFEADRG